MAKKKIKKLEITQTKSGSGQEKTQRRTLEALGFKRHQQTVVHVDTPQIRGMVNKISHLVSVRELDD